MPQKPGAATCLFHFYFLKYGTVFNFKTSLQNLAAGIQKNTHKSMSTLGTIVYNSDLFSDINTINTMAAAVIANYTGKVAM